MGFLTPLLPAIGAAVPGIGAAVGASALPALGAAAAPAAAAALPAAGAAAPALGGLSKLFNSPMMSTVGNAMTAANQPGQQQAMPELPQQRPAHTFRDLLPQLMGEIGANYLGRMG